MKTSEEIQKIAFDLLEEIQQYSEHPEYQGLNTAAKTMVSCMNKIRISEISGEKPEAMEINEETKK